MEQKIVRDQQLASNIEAMLAFEERFSHDSMAGWDFTRTKNGAAYMHVPTNCAYTGWLAAQGQVKTESNDTGCTTHHTKDWTPEVCGELVAIRYPATRGGKFYFADINDTVPAAAIYNAELLYLAPKTLTTSQLAEDDKSYSVRDSSSILDWYGHPKEGEGQGIYVMLTTRGRLVHCASGNELKREYQDHPDSYITGPIFLPLSKEDKGRFNDYTQHLIDKF